MDKREAYRICHVYPDKEIPFMHRRLNGVTYEGTIRKLDRKECKTYYPFTVEITGHSKLDDGNITCYDIGRRYYSIEDAVVAIWNGMNENAQIRNRYNSLEDILFKN